MPAWSIAQTERRIAREVVVAVAGSTVAIVAADDDVGSQGRAGTEVTVGLASRADPLTGGLVVDRALGGDQGSGCRDDGNRLEEHFDFGCRSRASCLDGCFE